MFGSDAHPSSSGVQDRPPGLGLRLATAPLRRWQAAPATQDAAEAGLVRRARRQAVLLMLTSAVVSVSIIYSAWSLIAALV